MMSLQNVIGNAAVVNVQAFFLARYKSPELIAEYVKFSLLYHREIPFLYRVFKPTEVPSKKEKSGYKVVSASPSAEHPIPLTSRLVTRLAKDCFKTKPFSTPCSSTLVNKGSNNPCHQLCRRKHLLECLPWSARRYVFSNHFN